MTPSIVEGLKKRRELSLDDHTENPLDGETPLDKASVGNAISHGQIVDLWNNLRDAGDSDCRLETLLQGSKVYITPPPPKPEPSNEYKTLMARLRHEEEERAYERMVNRRPAWETSTQGLPATTSSSLTYAFAETHRPKSKADLGDDDVEQDDVHRQMMLILNFALSILGVAGTLWVLARWWSTPARLFLSMAGSVAVGIAEYGLYRGYIWHLGEAKKKDTKFKEVKEVVQTWVVGEGTQQEKDSKVVDTPVAVDRSVDDADNSLRKRGKYGTKSVE